MINIDCKPYWVCPSGEQLTEDEFAKKARALIDRGSRVYVGTDSMLRGANCIFASVIAFHNNEKNIATYYYKKFRTVNVEYQNIKNKITEEVNLSVQAAQKISVISPLTNVEVHVDIGSNKENKTRSMMSIVTGWVSGMGYDLKIKPDCWAAFSIADNHTK